MIKKDAKEEHVHDEGLQSKKCIKYLYDNVFKSSKNVGDDNLKYHLINEFIKAKLQNKGDVSRLLIYFLIF
jgi:hypothetical protein